MMRETIHVLLVDDHAVVREGYRRLLEKGGDICVVGEAQNGAEAYDRFCRLQPAVVVLDIALPEVSGIEAMRRMLARKGSTRVLMFSMYEDAIYADRALKAGASGYVTKASAPAVLLEAVHSVARGKRYLSPDVAQKLALRAALGAKSAGAGLSPREIEILHLIVVGLPLPEIARSMGLNAKTIANHQSQIKSKLGAHSAVQLIRIGAQVLSGASRERP